MNKLEIKNHLSLLADPKLQAFSKSLTPGAGNLLGVRIPELQKLAKLLAKSHFETFFATETSEDSFEEITLQGLVLGYAKIPQSELEKHLQTFIPKITNWSTCDVVCASLKAFRKNRAHTWEFLSPYFNSSSEFEVRFAVVTLLDHFLISEELNRIFVTLNQIQHQGYYAKMAIAWTIATAFAKFPKETHSFLKTTSLDTWTIRKSIQKIKESRRIPDCFKKELFEELYFYLIK